MGHGWSTPKQGTTFKCVVIGETGSGKTSFLNLLANISTVLRLDKDSDISLSWVQHLHREAQTEAKEAKRNQSQTKRAFAHKVRGLGFDLVVIDTPGFGDAEGLDEDKRHQQSIEEVITAQDSINCIVLVMNGRVARLTPQLRYVLATVCSILPEQIMQQVLVVFTQVKDPDDLLFEPDCLSGPLGQAVPDDRQLCIDNPYAKVARLAEKGSRDEAKKLRLIKADFLEVAEELRSLSEKICSFPAVETHVFKQLYDEKKSIERMAMDLNQKLEHIHDQREHAEKLKAELEDVKKSKEAVSAFQTSKEVGKWELKETPGRHHMICSECKNTCHSDCHIEKSMSKEVFKNCECFQWKREKNITIATEAHRSQLLEHVCNSEQTTVHTETTEKIGTRQVLVIASNVRINGKDIRGAPHTTWINHFSSDADCCDEKETTNKLRQRSLPFTVKFRDWSNVECGEGMPCRWCHHPLASHAHQTAQWEKVWVTQTFVDEDKKAKFAALGSDEERRKEALSALSHELRSLEEQEQETARQLRTNLRRFGLIAAMPSFQAFLAEQRTYLLVLKKNALAGGKAATVKALDDQMAIIESRTSALSQAGSRQDIPDPAATSELSQRPAVCAATTDEVLEQPVETSELSQRPAVCAATTGKVLEQPVKCCMQ